jgi:glucokinase
VSASDRLAIGIDAGGTKVEALLVELGEEARVLDRIREETPAEDGDAAVATMIRLAGTLAGRGPVRAVGVGAAGLVDRSGRLLFAPNVAWRDRDLGAEFGSAFHLPTVVENDANVAAWGEFRYGAGRGCDHLLMITVGTGIGGGLVAGGRLYRGAHGIAGEIGHFVVEPGGPLCGCGNQGCWETVASGRAIERLGRSAAQDHPEGHLSALAGGHPGAVTGPMVTQAARDGDPISRRVLAQVGRRLGEGIAGLVNVVDPDVVVVGGGGAGAGELLLEPARAAYRDEVEAYEERPDVPIVPAQLGSEAGPIGAAALALELAERGEA